MFFFSADDGIIFQEKKSVLSYKFRKEMKKERREKKKEEKKSNTFSSELKKGGISELVSLVAKKST